MVNSYSVRDVGSAEAESALVEMWGWGHVQTLGYHHLEYQRLLTSILDDELRCLVVCDQNDVVCGVMPFRQKRVDLGVVINALPFFGCNGVVAVRGDEEDITLSLFKAFRLRVSEEDVVSAAFYAPFNLSPAKWRDTLAPDEIIVKFTHCLELGDGEPVWPPKRRGDLRRAHSRGFDIRSAVPDDCDHIRRIYSENCVAAGIPVKPESYIRGTVEIADRLGKESPVRWLVATLDETVVAALMSGRGPRTGSYTLPCAQASVRNSQPNALLMDAAIREGWNSGMRYWNFESSPEWGGAVFKFKERWGAKVVPFAIYMFYGSSGTKPTSEQVAEIRADVPFYFIAPVGQVTGQWPSDVSPPSGFDYLR